MKIKIALTSLMLMLAVIMSCVIASADGGINVTVSIANGELVLSEAALTVTDEDGDGSITINDALICAHKSNYTDGADGFMSVSGDYGLSMTKLWGIENGGSYGYYVNNTTAMSLADEIKNGDRIYAFVYTDTTAFSDMFTYFDISSVTVTQNGSLTLTLNGAGYDENWSPITVPVENAVITINGQKTNIKTDKNGKAVISLENTGKYVISAVSDTSVLVPAVCVATVKEPSPQTSDSGMAVLILVSLCSLFAGYMLIRKRTYAK